MNSDMRVWTYRHYVANSLRFIPQNKYLQSSLYDVMHPAQVDERSAEEIVEDVMAKAGLTWSE